MAEVFGVPKYDDGGQEVQPSHSVMLPLGGAVADFTLTPNPQSILQGVMGFAFVQSNIGAALHRLCQVADRHARSDAFSLWADYAADLVA